MIRALATLALLLVGATLLNGRLERAAHSRRSAIARIERFLDPAVPKDARIAAVTLGGPGGAPSFVYARVRGRWRCVSAFQAPCDDAQLEQLVLGLLQARGVVRSSDPASLAAYGLGDAALRIALHGPEVFARPDQDLLCEVRVGAHSAVAGSTRAGWSFAALAGRSVVHELDVDLRAGLEADLRQGFPPLLELRVAPKGWLQGGARIERVRFEPAEGPAFELVRRQREPGVEPPPDEPPVPWEWFARGPQGEQRCPTPRAEALCAFLQTAPYRGLEDPRRAAELGLGAPRLRVTAQPTAGEPLVLHLGGPAPAGGVWVWNRGAALLCSVDDEVAELLAPTWPALVAPPPANPWDRWLRER